MAARILLDPQFVAAVEDKHNCLEQSPLCVESQPELAGRRILVEVIDPNRPSRGLNRILGLDAVLECRIVHLHATYEDNASRIVSDRVLLSRAARASIAASS